ncbi:copper chaperone PCu(A)C [Telluria aromaticivorans]|uniref:Copper chaperone PCu(A)C n=1 Tax=Telluria aromaticivorans TaxID=2725995 RepID=A0A7Y2JZ08_9BURK|nr:copper chaperone PCu(A)C [Telluria aromaticivorans]NNG23570.1 copper chaperone PCu(A)C [Telluria aromaticivorans]
MTRQLLALLASGLLSASAFAQVSVTEPWIRATVPQQKVTGAFMRVQSATPARLVGVQTEVAGRAELHEMAMDGQTMRMRRVESIELPAGKPVNLASGGYHVMLMDLKRQVKEGETVAVTLNVQDAAGKRQDVKVNVPVKPLTHSAHH